MTPSSYYDVVLLGTRLTSLLAGAVLAKRGFRVLILGQGVLPVTYEAAGMVWPRAPFTFLPAHTPIVRRTLSELALYQMVRRRMTVEDPCMQVALPKHRMDLALDPEALDREIEREFPEVKRPVEDLHRNVGRLGEAFDRLTERDLVWPPETFLERREFARATASRPFTRRGDTWDPFGEFAEDHPFRRIVTVPAQFTSFIDPTQLGGIALGRLYESWLKGPPKLEGGYAWLHEAISEKIATYSGEIRARERASAILFTRGAASGVRLAGSGEEIGCSYVLAACSMSELLRLVPDRGAFEEVFERLGEPQPRFFRYTLNLRVRAEAIPDAMAHDVFFLRDPERAFGAENVLRVESHPADERGERLLCVEALLPRRGIEDVEGYIEGARERVLASLRELIPFLDAHLLWVDSPHDGRDAEDVVARRLVPPEEPWSRGPSTMEMLCGFPVRGALGVCALPIRTPLRRLLLCNDQVVPGLGLEGTFLTAWSAARIVTKSDRKKEWMRRGLWTKVEL
jgi:phytoene dehydrogenase-like protein